MNENPEPRVKIDDWVLAVLAELRKRLSDAGANPIELASGIALESVELDETLPTASIVVVFRDLTRSLRGRYAYRWTDLPSWFKSDWDAPEAHAHLIWANLEEATLEIPDHPGSDEIVWIN